MLGTGLSSARVLRPPAWARARPRSASRLPALPASRRAAPRVLAVPPALRTAPAKLPLKRLRGALPLADARRAPEQRHLGSRFRAAGALPAWVRRECDH